MIEDEATSRGVRDGHGRRRPTPGCGGTSAFGPNILYLPRGLGAAGFLVLGLPEGLKLVVYLGAALARVLVAVRDAWVEDARSIEPQEVRGWRRPGDVAAAVAAQDPLIIEVQPSTIRAYVSLIRRCARSAAADQPGAEAPEIIESRRGLGMRLAIPDLRVFDGSGKAPQK